MNLLLQLMKALGHKFQEGEDPGCHSVGNYDFLPICVSLLRHHLGTNSEESEGSTTEYMQVRLLEAPLHLLRHEPDPGQSINLKL